MSSLNEMARPTGHDSGTTEENAAKRIESISLAAIGTFFGSGSLNQSFS
jgi:hypothetical protein